MNAFPRMILVLLALPVASLAIGRTSALPADIHLLATTALSAPQSSQPPATAPEISPAASPESSEKKVTAYTLPPDLYRKARDLGRFHARFAWIDFF